MIPYHIYMSCYNYLNYNTYHVPVGSTVRIISTSTLVAINDKYRGDLDPVKRLCECMSAWLREEDKVKDRDGPSWLS